MRRSESETNVHGEPLVAARDRRPLSHRRFVGAAAATLGSAATATGFGGVGRRRGATAATATAQENGAPLVEPPVRLSLNGVLSTTLQAGSNVAAGPGRMNYEGNIPGPTLRLRPGDLLKIKLINNLGGGGTNLHVHGLHVSPRDNGDNVFVHVMPGESFDYAYQIPADHPSGTFWYHPHNHGDSMQQVANGLGGALIIEGGLDDLPGIVGVPERLLVLQGPFFGAPGPHYLVNGQINPTIAIAPGQTQRWRILNASANNFFNLQLIGHRLHRIALDGNPLPEVWSVDQALLGPAERVDVLIQGNAAGTYELRSIAWGERGQAQPDFTLATVVSAGAAQEPTPLPTTLLPFTDLSTLPIDRQRVITFQENTQAPYFAIDGKAFDPDRVDQTVKLGATEEWVIRNASPEWHPFHIHVNDFQPITIDRVPQPPHYEDTIPVPPNGELVARIRFLDFTGKFVYHCHILGHEDAGMMGVVEVVE